jgi:enoyl-CoA hydratase/carnithine racemase
MHEDLDAVVLDLDEETGIATLTLDRPDALNALNDQIRADIETSFSILGEYDTDTEGAPVRVVVIEGAGDRAFCAGADINEFSDVPSAAFEPHSMRDTIMEFTAPVIAKIGGYCLGGGFELALACDFRIASESSRLGFPEVDLGIIPGAGGLQYVSRLAGPAFAKEIGMTGEHVTATRAADHGLLNHVYPDAALDEEVAAFAETIASKPPLAIRALKDSGNVAVETDLHEGRKYDRRVFATLLETDDHAEGARGFAEDDYEPEFAGR